MFSKDFSKDNCAAKYSSDLGKKDKKTVFKSSFKKIENGLVPGILDYVLVSNFLSASPHNARWASANGLPVSY